MVSNQPCNQRYVWHDENPLGVCHESLIEISLFTTPFNNIKSLKTSLYDWLLTFPTGGRGMLRGGIVIQAPENWKLTRLGFAASMLIFPSTMKRRPSSNSMRLLITAALVLILWLMTVQSLPKRPFFLKKSVSLNFKVMAGVNEDEGTYSEFTFPGQKFSVISDYLLSGP